jgi:hypothetical protein
MIAPSARSRRGRATSTSTPFLSISTFARSDNFSHRTPLAPRSSSLDIPGGRGCSARFGTASFLGFSERRLWSQSRCIQAVQILEKTFLLRQTQGCYVFLQPLQLLLLAENFASNACSKCQKQNESKRGVSAISDKAFSATKYSYGNNNDIRRSACGPSAFPLEELARAETSNTLCRGPR